MCPTLAQDEVGELSRNGSQTPRNKCPCARAMENCCESVNHVGWYSLRRRTKLLYFLKLYFPIGGLYGKNEGPVDTFQIAPPAESPNLDTLSFSSLAQKVRLIC